ncbi:kinesin-like protein KIN-7K, chloroplastic [Iris pallida]|uniref:Kinesin-like protein n=1 Tax=Iris pallida TaxID=29817 RepID=A0AAX6G332_IRIPA|nr:kinesin-like protein KIN-7K, chloroplastic [Iris pallida]
MIESSAHGDEYDGVMYSQLNLIDLAGSESSKTETTGLRRKEGSYINKSLLTLGTVIGKLSEGKACHVPYRDSKLTRLLQSSLSGHGHVSLICTVTPASSNMEETHNTLKFASRAKRVEIYASCNRIIDEKSLIKKYQKEISILKLELDQLKRGILPGISQEEIISLRQQLEEGQVKMQSRLEEEEEAKAALMSRIQRLTKLILVSTKNTIPGCLSDLPNHQRVHSVGEDDKSGILREGSPKLLESEGSLKDGLPSALLDPSSFNEDGSSMSSLLTETMQGGGGNASAYKLPETGLTVADQMDLLVEQVKLLAGDIAFSTSTLKRLVEQSVNDPDGSQLQIQNLEREIQEKRRHMQVLEQRIMDSGDASMANTSLVDMQQTVMKLMTQCSEKGFELEIKSADNRILQEQLQEKSAENKELHDKVLHLKQQLNLMKNGSSSPSHEQGSATEVYELRSKLQSQDVENKKLRQERFHLIEESRGLLSQNQKLAEEASYAKELASAAAVELKNLAEEVTRLSLENARMTKELLIAQEMAYSRGGNGGIRKNEGIKMGRKNRSATRGSDILSTRYDDTEYLNAELDDMKMELQARKQREAALEDALVEKELLGEEYKQKFDEAKKRETTLENDLAGMWVLVAKLKKGSGIAEFTVDERSTNGVLCTDQKENAIDYNDALLKERYMLDESVKANNNQLNHSSEFEPLLVRLKAKIQEMKEKDLDSFGNGDANSHVCKVCFEAPAAAVLLPCRHFCLCKPCSHACSECPLCRTKIADRIIAFTS